jgi:hypothetical protein
MLMNRRRENRVLLCDRRMDPMSVVSAGAATTRAVSIAPAPTREPAINAVLQVSG